VTLALVARLDTTLGRYPVRHYRTLHVDTGIAAENLYLVATALGLACCAVSGFHDTALTELLRLPSGRFPVLLFPVGHVP
jgi:SagB-type dehydrogenase family enzyme